MVLLFSSGFFPVWPLTLIGLLPTPFFIFVAIRYLVRNEVNSRTVKLSATAFLILTVGCFFLFNILLNFGIEFIACMTAPFGSAVAIILLFGGFPNILIYLLGISINFVSVLGVVKFIEKRIHGSG